MNFTTIDGVGFIVTPAGFPNLREEVDFYMKKFGVPPTHALVPNVDGEWAGFVRAVRGCEFQRTQSEVNQVAIDLGLQPIVGWKGDTVGCSWVGAPLGPEHLPYLRDLRKAGPKYFTPQTWSNLLGRIRRLESLTVKTARR